MSAPNDAQELSDAECAEIMKRVNESSYNGGRAWGWIDVIRATERAILAKQAKGEA